MLHRVTVALSPQKMGQISHLLQRENPARRRHLTYGHNRASPKKRRCSGRSSFSTAAFSAVCRFFCAKAGVGTLDVSGKRKTPQGRASPKSAAVVNDLRSVQRRFRRFVVFFCAKAGIFGAHALPFEIKEGCWNFRCKWET